MTRRDEPCSIEILTTSKELSPQAHLDDPKATETYLEQLTEKIALCCDASAGPKSNRIIRHYCTPDIVTNLNGSGHLETSNVEDLIKAIETWRRINAAWRIGAFNFNATLDRRRENAICWFTSSGSGGPGEADVWRTNQESVSKAFWRKRDSGAWECYRLTTIRGGGSWF
ncbi:hypothetical protein LTR37_011332 [Vermiconidia calcicola]|uniref:Uncharacterized protein n=1 Tax=Vermiconidia calcicola TaxID=1690605 RepID=A0ACC3N3T6_9PEZI|nr:hypothetical protein LTR37_011332 [Vermiconidia calcicola]